MFFKRLKRQFRTPFRTEGGFWVGDGEEATLVNPYSGRMFAYVHHDGYGKYYSTVIVSPWRALHLIRHEPAMLVSLLSFPRCTVKLFRLETDTIEDAKDYAVYGLGHHD